MALRLPGSLIRLLTSISLIYRVAGNPFGLEIYACTGYPSRRKDEHHERQE
jgi:hypothetical protein